MGDFSDDLSDERFIWMRNLSDLLSDRANKRS